MIFHSALWSCCQRNRTVMCCERGKKRKTAALDRCRSLIVLFHISSSLRIFVRSLTNFPQKGLKTLFELHSTVVNSLFTGLEDLPFKLPQPPIVLPNPLKIKKDPKNRWSKKWSNTDDGRFTSSSRYLQGTRIIMNNFTFYLTCILTPLSPPYY